MSDDAVAIRPADQPGDLGWMIMAHGELYAKEYDWDSDFEALVAKIIADYAVDHEQAGSAAWIAEVEGRRAGCIVCVGHTDDDDTNGPVAKLRLLLVDPAARGHGLGGRLIDTCLDHARRTGHRRITLWTNDVLVSARKLYQSRGFELIEEERHHSFGHDLVGQYWALDLAPR